MSYNSVSAEEKTPDLLDDIDSPPRLDTRCSVNDFMKDVVFYQEMQRFPPADDVVFESSSPRLVLEFPDCFDHDTFLQRQTKRQSRGEEEKHDFDTEDEISISSEEDDDDESSSFSSSVSSILSSRSGASSQLSIYYSALDKLPKRNVDHLTLEFNMREEFLHQISKGMSCHYTRMLQNHETEVRRLVLEKLEEEQKKRADDSVEIDDRPTQQHTHNDNKNDTKHEETPLISFHDHIEFEMKNSIPGGTTLLLYCLAHVSIFELWNTCLMEYFELLLPYQTMAYALLLIIGLFLARSSGMVLNFLSEEKQECAKLDYSNRIRLQVFDGKILQWFRENRFCKGLNDISAFYFCYISVVYFLSKLAMLLDERSTIMAMLPSNQPMNSYGACVDNAPLINLLQTWNITQDDYDSPLDCSTPVEIDDEYMYRALSKSSYYAYAGIGDAAPLYSWYGYGIFYASSALCSVYILAKCGYFFWENW